MITRSTEDATVELEFTCVWSNMKFAAINVDNIWANLQFDSSNVKWAPTVAKGLD